MIKKLTVMTVACLLAFAAQAQEVRIGQGDVSADYLFDAITKPEIRGPISKLLKGQDLPAWAQVTKNSNYVAGAPRMVNAPMSGSILYDLCKPHDCGDNQMRILVTEDRSKAYAVISERGKLRYLGGPDAAAKSILDASLAN